MGGGESWGERRVSVVEREGEWEERGQVMSEWERGGGVEEREAGELEKVREM